MSIIQNIRDKYARWAVIAIALALLGFIMMDAFSGRTGLFSDGQSNTVAKVNGISIDRTDFEQKIKEQETAAASQGYELGDEQRQQISEGVWENEVTNIIMADEYEKLGLTVTDKEMDYALYGPNPPQFLSQGFTDSTGKYNGDAARRQIATLLKTGTLEQKDYITKQKEYIKKQRLMGKYMALMTNTVYYPKWFLEKRNADNSYLGRISYVMVPYTTVPDSSIKISDDEIKTYLENHKSEFEQKEETRSIDYVMFNAAPSSVDTAAVKTQVEALREKFAAATDPAAFLLQQGSTITYFDNYVAGSTIQVPAKDSIFKLPKGGIYGPYLDANTWVMAKMIDVKVMPDSAKVKHILISTNDPQSGKVLLADSIAKARIDSIRLAINNGASFDTLAKRFSSDKSSAEKGGLVQIQTQQNGPMYDYFTPGNMVKAFNDSVFNGRAGQDKVVKTEFGYHLIRILDLKNIEPHYKIAYLAKQIIVSNKTDQDAHNQANLFAGDSRDPKSFDENFNKSLRTKGFSKLSAANITPMSYGIQGFPTSSRSFVKKIFEADKGDVLSPERIGNFYVVAVVREVNEPGLPGIAAVRDRIAPRLISHKKAEQIIKNIGQITTLEQVSEKMRVPLQTTDSIRFSGSSNMAYEPKLLGATFNPAYKGKVITEAIEGNSGVFVLRVDNVTTVPVESANIEDQRRMMEMQVKQSLMQDIQQGRNPITDVLKNNANIKDNRSKFF